MIKETFSNSNELTVVPIKELACKRALLKHLDFILELHRI